MARTIIIHKLKDLEKLISANILNKASHLVVFRYNVFVFLPKDPARRSYIVVLTFSKQEEPVAKKTYQKLQKESWLMVKGGFKT